MSHHALIGCVADRDDPNAPNSPQFWGGQGNDLNEQVGEILLKAEIIVPNPDRSWLVKYVPAPDVTWSDVEFCAREASQMVAAARQDRLRKRLQGVL